MSDDLRPPDQSCAKTETLVSVIVCFLNEERYLGDAIQSVLAQTHENWELVLVDDGSTDGSTAIARQWAEVQPQRIRYVDHDGHRNRGLAASRNLGLSKARGDFVAFLDADDLIESSQLEQLITVLDADAEIGAAYCGWKYITPDGKEAFGSFACEHGDMFVSHAQYCVSVVHTYVVRRTLVEAVGGFDSGLRSCEDWDLWQRIARVGTRFGVVRDKLATYRIRPGSMTSDGVRILADGMEVLRRGHSADPRVPTQHPVYPEGLPGEQLPACTYDLLCACAGYEIGGNRDARSLLAMMQPVTRIRLDPLIVARAIMIHSLVASSRPQHEWPHLWPMIEANLRPFLSALEAHAGCPRLARRTLPLCRYLHARYANRRREAFTPRSMRVRLALMAYTTRFQISGVLRAAERFVATATSLVQRPEWALGMTAPSRPGAFSILFYERIGGTDGMVPALDSSVRALELHLRFLRERSCLGMTLDEWQQTRSLNTDRNGHGVLFAFRANQDFLIHAWPALKSSGYPIVLLVPERRLRRLPSGAQSEGPAASDLSWWQIRALQSEGVTFGIQLASVPEGERRSFRHVLHRLTQARQLLERELGEPITTFAYAGPGHSVAVQFLGGMSGFIYGLAEAARPCSIKDPLLRLPTLRLAIRDSVDPLAGLPPTREPQGVMRENGDQPSRQIANRSRQ